MSNSLYAAIDLGGTKIYTVLTDNTGKTMSTVQVETKQDANAKTIILQIVESINTAHRKAGTTPEKLAAVGICVAGFYNWQTEILETSPNIPSLSNIAINKLLAKELNVPVIVENDANAAAFGEARCGAGKGYKDLIFITVSTGIGAGLVLDGKIYRGVNGFAGEAGHFIVKQDGIICGCGQSGCLETVSSGTAIARAANMALKGAEPTILKEEAEHNNGSVDATNVFWAAKQGDQVAKTIIHEAIDYLSIALVNMFNLLNPAVLVIGGGVAQAGDAFLLPLKKAISLRAHNPAAKTVHIKQAQLGVEAGTTGMISLLLQEFEQ